MTDTFISARNAKIMDAQEVYPAGAGRPGLWTKFRSLYQTDLPALQARVDDLEAYVPDDEDNWTGPPETYAEALDELAGRTQALEDAGSLTVLNLSAAVGAEADNARTVTITCTDAAGDPVASGRVWIELLRADGRDIDTSQQALGAPAGNLVATGTALTTGSAGSAGMVLAQAAAGTIAVVVTDKSTSLEGDVILKMTPAEAIGAVKFQTVTFA